MGAPLKKSNSLFTLTGLVVVLLAVAAWQAPFWRSASASQTRPANAVYPTIGPVRDVIIAKGTVTLAHQLTLRAPVSGRISGLTVREGSDVRAGQRLLRIDDAQDDAELELRKLELQRNKAKLAALEREQDVIRRLVEIGSSARYELEQKSLEADLARKDISRAELELARFVEKKAQSTLASPEPGMLVAIPVVTGQFVHAGDELLTLAGGAARTVVAYVDAMDLERLSVGQAVEFSDQEDVGIRRRGKVKEIGRAVGGGQRQNAVKLVVEPLDPIDDLRISQQLYVEFVVLDEAQTLRVPKDYVSTLGDQKFVYVATAQGIDRRPVKTLRGDANFERVLAGVGIDDQLVRRPEAADAAR